MTPNFTTRPIESLKLNDANPRKIDKARFADLVHSMKSDPDFLSVRRIIVNTRAGRDGIVIAGNMRVRAAKEIGLTEVPVIEVDVDERTERSWLVKDNAHHGIWDKDMLVEMVTLDAKNFEHTLPTKMIGDLLAVNAPDLSVGSATPDAPNEPAKGKTETLIECPSCKHKFKV